MTGSVSARTLYRDFFRGLNAAEIHRIARVKRFIECWLAWPDLRDAISSAVLSGGDLHAIRARWNIEYDFQEMVPWLPIVGRPAAPAEQPDAVRQWVAYRDMIFGLRAPARDMGHTGGLNPAFDRWRDRQMRRCDGELSVETAQAICHPVIAFELSSGCSVGCWFCGVSAEKFRGAWDYETNQREWRDIIAETVGFFGPAASSAFCYWATDPIDNPDYDRFVTDLADAVGHAPQTTTAAAGRDPALVRRLLALSARMPGLPMRFSVLTRRQMGEIHRLFTPDELLHVEMVLQMRGGGPPKAAAGRALEKINRDDQLANSTHGTIACVTGFLVNMPERTIRLITPERSSATNPDGFRILGRATFGDAASFGAALRELAEHHIFNDLGPGDILRLRPSVALDRTDDGFTLTFGRRTHTVAGGFAPAMANILAEGGLLVRDVYDTITGHPSQIFELGNILDTLFEAGMLLERGENRDDADQPLGAA